VDDQGIGVRFWAEADISLLPTAYRLALEPTQCPLNWTWVYFNTRNWPVPIWPWNSTVYNQSWTSIQDLFHPNSWQTPVAAVTAYSVPDDGPKGRPKHVERTCSC